MPRKSAANANKINRYATTSVVAKPKPAPPVLLPKEAEKEEEVVDPYSYFTTETFFLEDALPESIQLRVVGEWTRGSTTSFVVTCKVEDLGMEKIIPTKYTLRKRLGSTYYYDAFEASNVTFWERYGNPVNDGWVAPHEECRVVGKTGDIKQMHAYRVTYKYLPKNVDYKTCYLMIDYHTVYTVIGSFSS